MEKIIIFYGGKIKLITNFQVVIFPLVEGQEFHPIVNISATI